MVGTALNSLGRPEEAIAALARSTRAAAGASIASRARRRVLSETGRGNNASQWNWS